MSVLLIFLDGFGLGANDHTNPIAFASMPFLTKLLGGALTRSASLRSDGILLRPVDARLHVQGLPQSATGQTALFTGVNAAAHLGYHLPAFPDSTLKEIIDRHTLLKRVTDAGGRATFANAYTSSYFESVRKGQRRHSVTTLSVLAAGIPFRFESDLRGGKAVYWDITRHRFLCDPHHPIPPVSPHEAGYHLASVAAEHDLTIFECFLPDLIGHRRDRASAVRFCAILDAFLAGVAAHLPHHCTLLVSSDHGNMEDLTSPLHTLNPVPLLALGPHTEHFASAESITDIAPRILSILGCPPAG